MDSAGYSDINDFSNYSKEELLDVIKSLKEDNARLRYSLDNDPKSLEVDPQTEFRHKYAEKILEALPDMLTVVDDKGSVVAIVSSEDTNHTGIPRDQIYGTEVSKFLPKHVCDHVFASIDQAIEFGHSCAMKHVMYVEGKAHYFENRTVRIDNGYNLCLCRDITDVMLAKSQLESLSYAVNQVKDSIFSLNSNGEFIFANKQFLVDIEQTDVIGKTAINIVFKGNAPQQQWQNLRESIRTEGSKILKYVSSMVKSDGSVPSFEVAAHCIHNINNDEEFWFFARNITTRLERDNKLKDLNTLMDAILNNIPIYLFVKDMEDYKYIYWNDAVAKHTGIPSSKAIGNTDSEIFSNQENSQRFKKDDEELLLRNERVEFLENYTTASGEERVVKTIKLLIPREERKPLLMGVSVDITDMKIVEAQLIDAKKEAEESNRLKSAFLANMSHEIRTPLNAIVGFSKLMLTEEDYDTQVEFSDIIDRNAELLLQLINDILDLSKIEANTLDFVTTEMDFNELCYTMQEVHKLKAKEGVSVIYEGESRGFMMNGDRNRLAQVFTNLLSNAIKFTTAGEIRFGYNVENGYIHSYVRDTGTGISKEKLATVFDRFVKLNNFAQGTGLGLSITKTIVERVGGKISVDSELGKWTEFRFSIPYKHDDIPISDIAAMEEVVDLSQTSSGKTVLIVDDNDNNYIMIKKYLGNSYKHYRASDGEEAVEMFKKYSPSIIFMDMKMPKMDGIEATLIIRSICKNVPIIASTAFAYDSDKERIREAGCNEFLINPISFREFKYVLDKYILK